MLVSSKGHGDLHGGRSTPDPLGESPVFGSIASPLFMSSPFGSTTPRFTGATPSFSSQSPQMAASMNPLELARRTAPAAASPASGAAASHDALKTFPALEEVPESVVHAGAGAAAASAASSLGAQHPSQQPASSGGFGSFPVQQQPQMNGTPPSGHNMSILGKLQHSNALARAGSGSGPGLQAAPLALQSSGGKSRQGLLLFCHCLSPRLSQTTRPASASVARIWTGN
jgi:hypothetical protein